MIGRDRLRGQSVGNPAEPSARAQSSVAPARQIGNAYLLMAPAIVLVLGVMGYPLAWQVWISLTDLSPLKDGPAEFVGLNRYLRVLSDRDFWRAATLTLAFAALTRLAKLALGMGFALHRARRRRSPGARPPPSLDIRGGPVLGCPTFEAAGGFAEAGVVSGGQRGTGVSPAMHWGETSWQARPFGAA